jgi:hypothetical protein
VGSNFAWYAPGQEPINTSCAIFTIANPGETTLFFAHTGWADDYPRDDYAHANFAWGQIVARLKAYAETGQPQPFFDLAAANHA